MTEVIELLSRAASLLRDSAEDDEAVTAFVIAAATFTAMNTMPANKITDEFKNNRRFRKLLLDAADTLEPLCPHCRTSLDNASTSKGEQT